MTWKTRKVWHQTSAAGSGYFVTERYWVPDAPTPKMAVRTADPRKTAAEKAREAARDAAARKQAKAAAAAAARRRVWAHMGERSKEVLRTLGPMTTKSGVGSTIVAGKTLKNGFWVPNPTEPGRAPGTNSILPGSRYALKPGQKDIRPSGGFDNSFNVAMAKEQAAKAKAKASKKASDNLAHVKVMEDVLKMARKGQSASRGHKLNAEYVGAVWAEYMAHEKKVRTAYAGMNDRLDKLMTRGKDGQLYYKTEADQKRGQTIVRSDAYKTVAAEMERLHFQTKTKNGYEGAYQKTGRAVMNMAEDQRQFTRTQAYEQYMAGATGPVDYFNRKESWEKYGKWAYDASADDIKPGETGYKLVKDKKTGEVKKVKRTAEEEYEFRKAQDKRRTSTQIDLAKRAWEEQQKHAAGMRQMPTTAFGGDDATRIAAAMKVVGVDPQKGIANSHQLDKVIDKAMEDWGKKNRVRIHMDKSLPGNQLEKFNRAAEEQRKRFYAMFGKEPTADWDRSIIPFAKPLMQVLGTAAALPPMLARQSALTGGGYLFGGQYWGNGTETSKIGGVEPVMEEAPPEAQAIMDKAFADAKRAGKGAADAYRARELAYEKWIRTPNGKRWYEEQHVANRQKSFEQDTAFEEKLRAGDKMGVDPLSLLDRLGNWADAVTEYGSEPFQNPMLSLASGFFTDPTAALPLNFLKWGARIEHVREVTLGMSKLKKFGVGVLEFQKVNEEQLKATKQLAKLKGLQADGAEAERLTQEMLQELAGIAAGPDRARKARKLLVKWGFDPESTDGKLMLTNAQMAIVKALAEAGGVDYRDVARRAQELEGVARQAEREAREAMSPNLAKADADEVARRVKEAEAGQKARQTLAIEKEANTEALATRVANQPLFVPAAPAAGLVHETLTPLSRQVDNVFAEVDQVKVSAAAAEGGASRPKVGQAAADLSQHITGTRDVFHAGGYQFARGEYLDDLVAGDQFNEAVKVLSDPPIRGRTPEDIALRAEQEQQQVAARAFLHQASAESIARQARVSQGIGRPGGSLVEGHIPWEKPKKQGGLLGTAYAIIGGVRSSKQHIVSNVELLTGLMGSRTPAEELANWELRREFEDMKRRLVSAGALRRKQVEAGETAVQKVARDAKLQEVKDEIRSKGVYRRTSDLTADLRSQHGVIVIESELDHIRAGEIDNFIPLGDELVRAYEKGGDYMAVGQLGRLYETLSLLPELRMGVGRETEVMDEIMNPGWRAALTPDGFDRWWVAQGLERDANNLLGPNEFRQKATHVFALFHMLLLDAEGSAAEITKLKKQLVQKEITKEEYLAKASVYLTDQNEAMARLFEMSKRVNAVLDDDSDNIFANMWKVMETRAGVMWADSFADAESAFMAAVVRSNNRLHPSLALAMIPYGPIARTLPISHGFTGHLRNLATSLNPLVQASPAKWTTDDHVFDAMRHIAGNKITQKMRMVKSIQISHYIASRYGSVERRLNFRLAMVDYSIGATVMLAEKDRNAALVVNEIKRRWMETQVDPTMAALQSRGAANRADAMEHLERRWHQMLHGRIGNKPRRGYDDEVRDIFEEMYWNNEVSHTNTGLHTQMFLAKMADPALQRGDSYVHYAQSYFDHMVVAGNPGDARDLLRELFQSELHREGWDAFEAMSGDFAAGGTTRGAKQKESTEMFMRTGLLTRSMLHRAREQGLARGTEQADYSIELVERQVADDELALEETTLIDRQARALAGEPVKMYDAANIENLGAKAEEAAGDLSEVMRDERRLETGHTVLDEAYVGLQRAEQAAALEERRVATLRRGAEMAAKAEPEQVVLARTRVVKAHEKLAGLRTAVEDAARARLQVTAEVSRLRDLKARAKRLESGHWKPSGQVADEEAPKHLKDALTLHDEARKTPELMNVREEVGRQIDIVREARGDLAAAQEKRRALPRVQEEVAEAEKALAREERAASSNLTKVDEAQAAVWAAEEGMKGATEHVFVVGAARRKVASLTAALEELKAAPFTSSAERAAAEEALRDAKFALGKAQKEAAQFGTVLDFTKAKLDAAGRLATAERRAAEVESVMKDPDSLVKVRADLQAAKAEVARVEKRATFERNVSERLELARSILDHLKGVKEVPGHKTAFGEGTAAEVARAEKRVANLHEMALRVQENAESAGHVLREPPPRPSGARMKNYYGEMKGIRSGRAKLSDDGKRVIWAAKGETFGQPEDVGKAVQAYLRSEALPVDARDWLLMELRRTEVKKRLNSLFYSLMQRSRDLNSISAEVGAEMQAIVATVKAVPGGEAWLKQWAATYYDDLLATRLIDYLAHEDWFVMKRAEELAEASRLAPLRQEISAAKAQVSEVADVLMRSLPPAEAKLVDEAVAAAEHKAAGMGADPLAAGIGKLKAATDVRFPKELRERIKSGSLGARAKGALEALEERERYLRRLDLEHKEEVLSDTSRRQGVSPLGAYASEVRLRVTDLETKLRDLERGKRGPSPKDVKAVGTEDFSAQMVSMTASRRAAIKKTKDELVRAYGELDDVEADIAAIRGQRTEGERYVYGPKLRELDMSAVESLPRQPSPDELSPLRVGVSHKGLEILQQMTEDEWLARELEKVRARLLVVKRGEGKRALNNRRRMIQRAQKVIEVEKSAKPGTYVTRRNRASYLSTARSVVGDRAKASLAAGYVAPYVHTVAGAETEQGRALNILLRRSPVHRGPGSQVRKVGEVSQVYVTHGAAIEAHFGVSLTTELLIEHGFPEDLLVDLTATEFITNLDEFGRSLRNPEFRRFVSRFVGKMDRSLREITGDETYTIEQWMNDRLLERGDHLDSRVYEKIDVEISDVKARVRADGKKRTRRTDLKRGTVEFAESAGDPLFEAVDTDIAVVIAKAKATTKHGVDVHAYNEGRKVLRKAYLRKKYAIQYANEADARARAILHGKGVSLADANWSKLYAAEYEKAFLEIRKTATDDEALKLLDQLAEDEMMGATFRELIEEFERRYGVDKDVKGYEPAPISEFQRRTLEEAVKTHLGVTDLDDTAQMVEALGRHGQKPPFDSREKMHKWLVDYGFWSPRTASDINSGKKSWSIFEETRFYKDNWGVAPPWADSDLLEEGAIHHNTLHDEVLRAETNREWGLFDRNMVARFHSATMTQAERVRFLVEGSAQFGVKAKRDVPLERRYVIERYGRLVTDDAGNLTAFPNLMTQEELRTYILTRTRKGLVIPEGVIQSEEQLAVFSQLLEKHLGRHIDELVMLGRTVEYEDVLNVAARMVTDMLENPLWLERGRDYVGKFVRGQAAIRRSFIFTQLAFMTTNVVDSGIKASWARFKLRSFMGGTEYAHALNYTLQDYGLKPHGALLRDEEVVGTKRIGASRTMPMKYRLYNGKVVEETADQFRLRRGLQVAQGVGEIPLQVSGAAEDFMKIRLARQMYGATFEMGMRELGDVALADAWARKFIGEEIGKMWPSSGSGPVEQLFNQISPFFSYQAKNRLIFINEMINHPYLFNFFDRIGDMVQLYNEQQHPGQGELDPGEARLFELPWAPGVFIDIGAWSDMQRGIKTLYDLTDEKTAPSALKLSSQFVRLAGAGDINMVLGILNAFHIGFRKEWQQDADGKWQQIEVPWEAPWGGDANWMNAFWPIEVGSKWAKAVEGKMTVSAVTLAAYQTMFFGGVKQHDRAAGLNSFYWALKDTDPVAAQEWLDTTPDGWALRMSWLDKTPKTYEWYTPENVLALFNPDKYAKTNDWFHSKDELFQKSVGLALDELDKIKHKWNNIMWELTPGTAEFARAKLDSANERFAFMADHPELYEFFAFSMSPEDWAEQYDEWTTDDMVDGYFDIKAPDHSKFKTEVAYQRAMDEWRQTRRQYLKDHPKVKERIGNARTSVEAIWKDTEEHWFKVLDRVGRRNVALEAARQAKDFSVSDQLWLANETDYKQLDIHEVVSYFNPETDYKPLLQGANYKDRQGPLQMRMGPFGQKLLPKVRILPSFDEWRYDRANEADKAKMRRDKAYGEGMKTVIDAAKKSGNFGKTFVDMMKADPKLMAEYFRRNPGKREQWAASDEYYRRISRYGLLAKAGKFDEAGRYFDSLPKWVQDRYYNAHPDRRQSRAERQQTLQYIGLMKRWTDYYKHRDYAGGAAFFEKLPQWAKDRYYNKHPDGFGRGTKKSSPYSRAMGKWVKLLEAGDKAGAKAYFDSMPAQFRERYYKGHPDARLRDDVKRSGQLGQYFAADDAGRAQYLKDNPEFAKWLHKQGDKDYTRNMLIAAAYRALDPDNQWLKRVFREKYPEVFSQEAKGAASLKKTYRFLAEHPEMMPAFERWLAGVMSSFEEQNKHHLARPKPVVSDHSRVSVHGARPKRMTPGQSAAWVRLHQTS